MSRDSVIGETIPKTLTYVSLKFQDRRVGVSGVREKRKKIFEKIIT